MDSGLSLAYEADDSRVRYVVLFCVSRIIHQETELLLYSKNIFYLPTATLFARFFSHCVSADVRKTLIKLTEFSMTDYDLAGEDLKAIDEEVLKVVFSGISQTQRFGHPFSCEKSRLTSEGIGYYSTNGQERCRPS